MAPRHVPVRLPIRARICVSRFESSSCKATVRTMLEHEITTPRPRPRAEHPLVRASRRIEQRSQSLLDLVETNRLFRSGGAHLPCVVDYLGKLGYCRCLKQAERG